MSDFAHALQAERTRQFSRAIALYSQLGHRLSTSAFEYNIRRVRASIESDDQRLTAGAFLAEARIQHVYVLNLASRPDKCVRVARELARVGIPDIDFVDGVDGWTDPGSQAACQAYRDRPPGQFGSSAHISHETQRILRQNATFGTFGYLISQRKIFEDAVRAGYERICVFDDDVIFVDGYESTLGRARQLLTTPWSVIHLGASEYSQPHPADLGTEGGAYGARPHGTCGSFAVLYDQAVFPEILAAIAELDGPFDNSALGSVYRHRPGQCHVLYPNVCAADVQSSSIRNPRDQFRHSARMRWPISIERYRAFRAPSVVNIVVANPALMEAVVQPTDGVGGDLIVNGFYLTDDGVRPLHSDRSCISAQDVEQCRARFDDAYHDPAGYGLLEGAALPRSDLTVLWPAPIAPTRESILSCLLAECHADQRARASRPRARVVPRDHLAVEQPGLVSVIVSTDGDYNRAKPTIESLIQQDHGDIEIIFVINDPAVALDSAFVRQDVAKLMREQGARRRRDFRIIQHSRTRLAGAARNTGLMASRGEFVTFVADDERHDAAWLSTSLGHLQGLNSAGVDVSCLSDAGTRLAAQAAPRHESRTHFAAAAVASLARHSPAIQTAAVIYHREDLLCALGFDEDEAIPSDVRLIERWSRRYRVVHEKCVGMQATRLPHEGQPAATTNHAALWRTHNPLIDRTRMEQVHQLPDSSHRPSLSLANHLARAGAHEQAIDLYDRLKVELPELRETIDFNRRLCAARMTGKPLEAVPASTRVQSSGFSATPSQPAGRTDPWQNIGGLGPFPKQPWVQEFGPGIAGHTVRQGVSLQCDGARFYFSHPLHLESSYRYLLRFRVRSVDGNTGDVAAVLVPERRSTLATAPSGSWGSDGICEVQFEAEEAVTASVRVGIGTTAPVSGPSRIEIDGIEILRRKVLRSVNPELGAFARQFIDPALRLPALTGLVNDYSRIEDQAQALCATPGWEKLRASVVVTGFGRPELLRKTLAALCSQNYPRSLMQVIVVDDGGDNDDYEKAFFDFDDRLELYLCRQRRDGHGASRARNLGARLATGEILVLLESDILLPENFISSLMAFHHVSDTVSVLAACRPVATEWIETDKLLAGEQNIAALDRALADETASPVDWRLADFETNGWLKKSRNPFKYFGSGVASVATSRYLAAGGYDECFKEWGHSDQEFAYRLWSRGQYFIPLQHCFGYRQIDRANPDISHRKLAEGQRTHRLLVDRCPHPSVRGFAGRPSDAIVPQFSIYIPAFNTVRYIRECLESALAQTYRDFEVVVVDDGSSDGTAEVLQSYRHDPRVRLITRSNGGIGAASNTALQACRGEYVVQLDSDDQIRPEALATVAAQLKQHPEIECLYTKYTLIDHGGNLLGPGWSPKSFDRYENLIGMSVPHMRVFRRALYFRTTGFDEGIVNAVDYDFYLKLAEVARIHFLDADLYLYRVHGTQTSSAKAGAQIRNHKLVVERHLERLGLQGFEVSSPNPFEPRKNYIALPGTDFALELAKRSFAQPAIENSLSFPEPKSVGNDYSAMQAHVRAVYTQTDPPPYNERISIIVPVYNRAERLSRCLAGIFHQSYPRDLIEVVIVDDGSSDEVMKVVRKYSDVLDITYVKQADRGYRLSAARNAGIKAARSRNISIIDCDLIPLREFIESFMQYLHHFDNVVLLGHQRFVDPTGVSDDDILADPAILASMRDIRSENSTMLENEGGITVDWRYELYKGTDYLKNDQFPYRAFSSGHVAYRKDLIERAGMYDEDFVVWGCEDNEAGYRIYQTGAFFIPVLEAIDLHQEPPSGKNETDREAHRKVSRQLLQEKVPATRGWFGKGFKHAPEMMPLVTIGVPVHNTGRYAVDAITSALDQDLPDIEVLVYDDASTDGTLNLIKAAFRDDLRVRLIEGREHRNVTYARNEIIRHARGEFIGFLDSDDLLEPNCVRECVTAFRADPGVGLVCTGYSRIGEDGASLGAGWSPGRFNREGLMLGNIFTHFRMFRVRDWNRSRKWDAQALRDLGYGEDWDLCMMLAEVSGFTRISKPLYKYRMRSSGITQSSGHDYKASQTRWVVQRWLDRLGRRDLEVISTSRTNPSAIGFVRR